MVARSITVTPAGMSTTGVGTRVAVTTTSLVAAMSSAWAATIVIPAKAGTQQMRLGPRPREDDVSNLNRRMRVSVPPEFGGKLLNDSSPAGSPPPHRYTPPEARVQSRRRPVSWLADHRWFPPSRLAAMALWEPANRVQLRGQQPCPRA